MALISVRGQAAPEPAACGQWRARAGEGESPGVSFARQWHCGRVRGLGAEHPSVPGSPGPEPGLRHGEGCWGRRAESSPRAGIPGAHHG